jgi:hypothetical protein
VARWWLVTGTWVFVVTTLGASQMEPDSAGRALLVFSSFDSAVPALRSVAASGYVSTLALGGDVEASPVSGVYDVVLVAEDLVDRHGSTLVDALRRFARADVLIGAAAGASSRAVRQAGNRPDPQSSTIWWGSLGLDPRRRSAWWCAEPLSLTPMQFRLLEALVRARGAVVPVVELYDAVFDDAFQGGRERLFAHVRRVRQLLERDPSRPQFLLTVRGEGFRLADGTLAVPG